MRADGSEQRPLTDNRWEEGTPAWGPGGREEVDALNRARTDSRSIRALFQEHFS